MVAGGLALVFGVYQVFLKANPEWDGRRAAAMQCECYQEHNKSVLAASQAFVDSFPASQFTRRADARARVTELRLPLDEALARCTALAQTDYETRKRRYVTNAEALGQFEFAFAGHQAVCGPSDGAIVDAANLDVERRIATINDPEPNIDQIKTDLIGRQVTGWRFDHLKEFKSAQVTSVSRVGERAKFDIAMHVRDERQNEHDIEAVASYVRRDGVWVFERVTLRSITWDNLIPVDRWTPITPLPNMSWTASNEKRLLWKAYDQRKLLWMAYDWGPEIRTGPDAPGAHLPPSGQYLIKSRESGPVVVRFTYRTP